MKAELEKVVNTLQRSFTNNAVIQQLVNDIDDIISTESLIDKLTGLQAVRFSPSRGLSRFFSETPDHLFNIPDLDKLTGPVIPKATLEMPYDAEAFKLLTYLQASLLAILRTRLLNQYKCTVIYDESMINQSTVFVNYQKTSRNKAYDSGSLVVDLGRGVSYLEGASPPVKMQAQIKVLEKKLADFTQFMDNDQNRYDKVSRLLAEAQVRHTNAKVLIQHGKMSQDELSQLQEDIEDLQAEKQMLHKQIQIYQKEIAEIRPLLQDKYLVIKKMTKSDDKKADILNRFGHQMIEAEFMREAKKVFMQRGNPQLSVQPFHTVDKTRTHQVVNENGRIYVDVKLSFDAFVRGDGLLGILDVNERNMSWTTDPNVLSHSRGVLMELKGQAELIDDPEQKGEYCMKINSFQLISHSADLIPRAELIPEQYITIEDGLRSPLSEAIQAQKGPHS